MNRDDDLRVRPGRIRSAPSPRAKPFLSQALAAAEKAGGLKRGGSRSTTTGGMFGRGRSASLRAGRHLGRCARLVVVKARVVRHRSGSAKLTAHCKYLRRDGVTRDGSPGQMFGADQDDADPRAFVERCDGDRHHFRFIVAPEDAAELANLRTYTRDLMRTAASDLGTNLDWIAVDHWNTAHPHIHVIVRGRADDGENLVISRDYIGHGLRLRASERATLELGPRSENAVWRSLENEVGAERWTSLDRELSRDAIEGMVDLRPRFGERPDVDHALKVGRMLKLERLGLAEPLGAGRWQLSEDAEPRLRDLQRRGDIIARLNDALGDRALEHGTSAMVLEGVASGASVVGRLAARGLDDELAGSAFVVIDAVDGRTHHVALPDLEAASDAPIGSIVEARWAAPSGQLPSRLVVAVRSDLTIERQVSADGATWLDRQLVGTAPTPLAGDGFGREVRDALAARTEHHLARGTAARQGSQIMFAGNLLATLRRQEIERTAMELAAESGLQHRPTAAGDAVAGVVRQRVTLASGRFAMIDDGIGFQLVPWSQPLAQRIGQYVAGTVTADGGVNWAFGRRRGLGV